MPQTSAPRKPGAGMMMQQTQPKLQHQASLLPPPNLEDIDDDEEMKYDSLHPIRNRQVSIGITNGNGLKIGSAPALNRAHTFSTMSSRTRFGPIQTTLG